MPGFARSSALPRSRREQQRDVQRDVPFDDQLIDHDASWPDHANRVDLERALVRLPPGFREVLVLHDVEGFTHEDIATMLGIQPGTSKSQLSRARSAMRRALHEPDTTRNTK